MFFKKQKNKFGFTLIEILIVIAIIGILMTIAIIALLSARVRANDTKRIYDVSQIKKALDLYYLEAGKYPNEIEVEIDGYLPRSIALPGEGEQVYMQQIPIAPKADGDCTELQNKYDYVKLRDNCAILSDCTAKNGPTVTSVGDCSVAMASGEVGGGWIIDLGGDETITIGADGGTGGSGESESSIECIINSDCGSGEICSSGHCLSCEDFECKTSLISDGGCIYTNMPLGTSCLGGAGVCETGGICRTLTYLGDGIIQSPNDDGIYEQCDDGNTNNGDGCSSAGTWETRLFSCSEKPLVGTIWNSVSSYSQTWNSHDWLPVDDNVTEYNVTSSNDSCQFVCDSSLGYYWNGVNCQLCDDSKECTDDSFNGSDCVYTNKTPGTVCSLGFCNDRGVCKAPVACSTTVNSDLTLYNDINCSDGFGLTIDVKKGTIASNIVIDCNGHSINCGSTDCYNDYGIKDNTAYLSQTVNVTIKNCIINNFGFGMATGGSPTKLPTDKIINNQIINSQFRGLWVSYTSGSNIKNNYVCSNSAEAYRYDIYAYYNNSITTSDNTCLTGKSTGISCNYSCP